MLVHGYDMPKIGDVIAGKYRLDKVAGEGGMGIVYAAEHLVLKQRVAVKVLLPDAALSEAVVERFAREARAAAKINSEHVARVLDAGTLPSGALFLVMEFLEGCDLEELSELQKTLPVKEVVDYLVQALEGLAHAHAAGVVHRDLKPANLFLACRPDGTNAIKLLDFGISKTDTNKPEDKRLTGHHVLGSPVYMSPEQLRNSPDIDGRADLWSIGVVGYELLAGVPPFDGAGVGEIFAAILEKSPEPLTNLNPKVPDALADVLSRCLRRDPNDRWGDAGELARALAPFASDPDDPDVSRAEQVLARARLMTVPSTPIETIRLVEAIDAAAERARTTATKSIPAESTRKKGSETRKKGSETRKTTVSEPPPPSLAGRRSPILVACALAAIVAGALGIARATRSGTASTSPTTARPGPAARPVAPAAEPSNLPADGTDDPPLVMDLPSTPGERGSAARARGSSPSAKPQRPKFLKSQE
jgi:serine/threonine-protein kinase